MPSTASDTDSLDVLIVGAGISGIGAAYYLQRDHPDRSYAILEAREASGGTWDLFRYPGIRSDSDLHTFGYAFKPWRDEEAIAGATRSSRYLRRPRPRTASTGTSASRRRWSRPRGPRPTRGGPSRSSGPTPASSRR
jgi:glycine/D-amino acid oxidase-like deaminating enzyme